MHKKMPILVISFSLIFTTLVGLGLVVPEIGVDSALSTDLKKIQKNNVEQLVPFTSQAPEGQWKNEIFQDGCEEASALMAVSWARGSKLNPKTTSSKIQQLVNFEAQDQQGYRGELSANDTLALIKNYFHFTNLTLQENITKKDVLSELQQGNIIIAPMNGRLLSNPYYTKPGPVYHMLVIIGYDLPRQEFITNDPGTRHGASFHYGFQRLMNALRDYPSGHHEPVLKNIKRIIVVHKESAPPI